MRASLKAKRFETVVVPRSRRFWALVTDEMEAALKLETGTKVEVSLVPLIR